MCDRELDSPSSRCLCSHSPRLFQVPAPGTGGFALPQPTKSGCVATSSWGLLLFPLQIKPALPVPAEQSSKAKQTRFLSGFPGRAAVVYVGPILLFLPVGLGGAGWGREAGEGFAAVPAQPLGSCLALRGDLQLPPGLLKGLIYVLLSLCFAGPAAADGAVLGLCPALLQAGLSQHPGPLVTQSLGCSSCCTPRAIPATSSPCTFHFFTQNWALISGFLGVVPTLDKTPNV